MDCIEDDEREEPVKEILRKNIHLWLEKYPVLNAQTTCMGIKDLLSLRNIEDKRYEMWHKEVLYLRDVQRNLTNAAHYSRNTFDQHEESDILSALVQILHPFDKIDTRHFPSIREIIKDPEECENNMVLEPYLEPDLKEMRGIFRNVG